MTFENGIFNLTNWTGNVIMPTLSGLFFAIALIRAVGPGQHQKWMWAGFLSLTVSGMLRGLETFFVAGCLGQSRSVLDGAHGHGQLGCNVVMPMFGVLQIVAGILHYAGIGHRVYGGGDWMRHFAIAAGCFMCRESCG